MFFFNPKVNEIGIFSGIMFDNSNEETSRKLPSYQKYQFEPNSSDIEGIKKNIKKYGSYDLKEYLTILEDDELVFESFKFNESMTMKQSIDMGYKLYDVLEDNNGFSKDDVLMLGQQSGSQGDRYTFIKVHIQDNKIDFISKEIVLWETSYNKSPIFNYLKLIENTNESRKSLISIIDEISKLPEGDKKTKLDKNLFNQKMSNRATVVFKSLMHKLQLRLEESDLEGYKETLKEYSKYLDTKEWIKDHMTSKYYYNI